MKVEIIQAVDKYAVRIKRGFWIFTDYKYCDLKNLGYEWNIDSKYFSDCWGDFEKAKLVYEMKKTKVVSLK